MIKIQLPLEIGNARTKLELRRPFRQELLVNKSFRNSKPRGNLADLVRQRGFPADFRGRRRLGWDLWHFVGLAPVELPPRVIHPMRERPVRTDGQNPKHRGHAIGKKVMRTGPRRERADNEKHDTLRPSQKTDVALRNQTLGARARIADHHRTHHPRAGQKHVERRVKLSVARVENHQADEHYHVRKAVER